VSASSRSSWWAAGLVAGGLALLYAPVLRDLFHVWRTDTYAAHGLLVIPYSAWVAFTERDRLRQASRDPRGWGWLVVGAGLAVLAAGRTFGSPALLGMSVPLVVSGWMLAALGPAVLRVLAFPVGFLVFLAPLPRPVVATVSLHLQRFAAWFGAEAASLLGVPVYQEGVTVALPALTLQVAEICNGLRFMSALVVLTVALGHAIQLRPSRQVSLVASAVLLAILANGTRILAILLGVQYYGPEAASGLIHHSIGKAVWALTLVPLGAVAWLLRRSGPTTAPTGLGAEGGTVYDSTT
jgi:exosortase